MTYKAVVFDLDGTLIDTMDDITRSLNTGLSKQGFTPLTRDECRKRVGWGLEKLVEFSLPENVKGDRHVIKTITQDLKNEYQRDPVAETRPYSGIPATLKALQAGGIPLFVWTNKEQQLGETILKLLFPDIHFAGILGDSPDRPKKPDPQASRIIKDTVGTTSGRIIYFGDSDVDMETAVRSGFRAIGVTWGYRSSDELILAGAEGLVHDPSEMLEYVTKGDSRATL